MSHFGEQVSVDAEGQLRVPNEVIIPYIEGDGIGKEVMTAALRVFDAAIEKCAYSADVNGEPKPVPRRIIWKEVLAGEKAFRTTPTHTWLPEETLEAFRTYRVGLKGPLTTPVGGGIRSLNVALRQELDLYVCLRPVRYFAGVGSPLKHPELVDMVVFRENTEDIYAGIEWDAGTPEAKTFSNFLQTQMGVKKVRFPESSSFGVKPVSKEGTERLVRAAIEYAISHHRPSVTIVHKGNIMKYTEGGFRNWAYALAESDPQLSPKVFTMRQYDSIRTQGAGKAAADEALEAARREGKVIVKDCIADAFLQNTLLKPQEYSVIATLNLNGDYISDQLAAMVGGIGIAPGANINYKTGHAIFEATHGTAPDIAGQQKANPSSLLLSGVMMFEYLGWSDVSRSIIKAMESLFAAGIATGDLTALMETVDGSSPRPLSTEQFADALIQRL